MVDYPPLYILGSSGLAREVAAYARQIWPGRSVFYVDRQPSGDCCLTPQKYWQHVDEYGGESIMGAGRCEIRERMQEEIRHPLATVIHPQSVVMGEVEQGCIVAPGAVIAPNARVCAHTLVNYNATVGHDALIGEFSVVGPGAAIGGWCRLERAVYIGAGALVREKLQLGHGAIVGMGAVVTKDVPAGSVAVGVPAHFREKNQNGGWLK